MTTSAPTVRRPARAQLQVLRPARALAGALTEHSLAVLTCCGFAILLIELLSRSFSTDGWLALVDGRLIAHHGLPHTNTMTLVGYGHQWIDQQWLGQLALYELHRLGGVKLLLGLNLVLVVAPYAAAMAYAVRRGGSSTTVAAVAALAFLPMLLASAAVRTQSLVYLPFVLLVAQLTRRELGARRILLLLLLLAVWGNVHGSVVLAAGLVGLRGLTDVWDRNWSRRTLLLVLGPVACVFASPYGFDLTSYYGATVFNPGFSHYLEQWAPSTLTPLTSTLYVLILGSVWVLGRARGAYTRYESLTLGVGILAALLAVRNWPFAALIMMMLLPRGLTALRPKTARAPSALAATVVAVALAVMTLFAVRTLTRPTSFFTTDFPAAAAALIDREAAAHPGSAVYASIRYADWLLWARPRLQGKIRFDARYELMKTSEIEKLVLFRHGAGVDDVMAANRILVLDPANDAKAIAAVRARGRILFDTKQVLVADVDKR